MQATALVVCTLALVTFRCLEAVQPTQMRLGRCHQGIDVIASQHMCHGSVAASWLEGRGAKPSWAINVYFRSTAPTTWYVSAHTCTCRAALATGRSTTSIRAIVRRSFFLKTYLAGLDVLRRDTSHGFRPGIAYSFDRHCLLWQPFGSYEPFIQGSVATCVLRRA
jgi:hypothetical protein